MDIVEFIAVRKIQEAIQSGLFDDLPPRDFIDCSMHGEAFFAKWFRERYVLAIEDGLNSTSEGDTASI